MYSDFVFKPEVRYDIAWVNIGFYVLMLCLNALAIVIDVGKKCKMRLKNKQNKKKRAKVDDDFELVKARCSDKTSIMQKFKEDDLTKILRTNEIKMLPKSREVGLELWKLPNSKKKKKKLLSVI